MNTPWPKCRRRSLYCSRRSSKAGKNRRSCFGGKAAAQAICTRGGVGNIGAIANGFVCGRDTVQAAVGCGGGEILKPARDRVVIQQEERPLPYSK